MAQNFIGRPGFVEPEAGCTAEPSFFLFNCVFPVPSHTFNPTAATLHPVRRNPFTARTILLSRRIVKVKIKIVIRIYRGSFPGFIAWRHRVRIVQGMQEGICGET